MLRKALFGLSVYVDGIDYLGVAESFTPPDINLEVVESNMPGHGGPIDIPTGRLEALETSFVMADSIPELEALVGNPASPDTPVLFSGVSTDGSENRSVEYEITGLWKSQVMGEVSGGGGGGGGDAGKCTYTISPRTLTHRIDGGEVRHIDLEQAIHRVNGTDVLAERRASLRRGRSSGFLFT